MKVSLRAGVEEFGGVTEYVLNPAFWLTGQALGFPVQFDLVLKHLRQDMRDDREGVGRRLRGPRIPSRGAWSRRVLAPAVYCI